MKDLVQSAQAGGVYLTAELLSCGAVDIFVSALTAVEKIGEDNANGNVVTLGVLCVLTELDLSVSQIEDKLRAIPSALRYAKESKLLYAVDFGMTAAVFATILAANLFGKDEENPFGFARECSPRCPAYTIGIIRLSS